MSLKSFGLWNEYLQSKLEQKQVIKKHVEQQKRKLQDVMEQQRKLKIILHLNEKDQIELDREQTELKKHINQLTQMEISLKINIKDLDQESCESINPEDYW